MERVGGGLGWEVEVECHFARGGFGFVGEFEEFAAEGGDCGGGLDGHGEMGWGVGDRN